MNLIKYWYKHYYFTDVINVSVSLLGCYLDINNPEGRWGLMLIKLKTRTTEFYLLIREIRLQSYIWLWEESWHRASPTSLTDNCMLLSMVQSFIILLPYRILSDKEQKRTISQPLTGKSDGFVDY